jgi:hypothetical protein
MLCCCAGSEYSKITESDFVARALTGGELINYRCYVVALARSIQKLPKVMLLQHP